MELIPFIQRNWVRGYGFTPDFVNAECPLMAMSGGTGTHRTKSIWGQVLYFAAIRNRHADRGAWMTAAHDTHGYTLAEIAATVGLQDTRPDPYFM